MLKRQNDTLPAPRAPSGASPPPPYGTMKSVVHAKKPYTASRSIEVLVWLTRVRGCFVLAGPYVGTVFRVGLRNPRSVLLLRWAPASFLLCCCRKSVAKRIKR